MKIEHQRKIPVPLLLAGGAVVLVAGIFGFSALASAATGKSGQPATGPAAPDDAALANQANAVFGASLAAANVAVAASCLACEPYAAAASTAVGAAWGNLSTSDKANVWRGKLSGK
jgi:hypothetical protein